MNNGKFFRFKRSPFVIVMDFIGVEILAAAGYIAVGFLAYYARIYRNLPIAPYVPYQIAQAVFLFTAETGLILYIFLRWHRESFVARDGQLTHYEGVIWRQEVVIPLSTISAIAYVQGPLAKRLRYGTLRLNSSADIRPMLFKHISDPQDVVNMLMRCKQGDWHYSNDEDAAPVGKFPKFDPQTVLTSSEHEGLEFKTTFRWDIRGNKVNKDLEKSAMKTVAAFLNTQGGHLVLGVDDTKNIVGMQADYQTLGKANADGFENHFSHIFGNMIGAEFRQFVKLANHQDGDREYCVVAVAPSPQPVYLKSDENEEFFIRTGNGTTSLKFSQAAGYMDSRFKKRTE